MSVRAKPVSPVLSAPRLRRGVFFRVSFQVSINVNTRRILYASHAAGTCQVIE